MTTTKTTRVTPTAAGPILAIDLGKYKSVACIYSGGGRLLVQPHRHGPGRGRAPDPPGRTARRTGKLSV